MDTKALEDLVARLCAAVGTTPNPELRLRADADGYRIITIGDRGAEYPSEPEPSLDAFLYPLIRGYVYAATFVQEQEELDVRRIRFARTLELLGDLNPEWAKRAEAEQQRLLEEDPFDDFRIRRREHAYELWLYQRIPDAEAKRMAAEKYPKPVPKRPKPG